MFILPQIFSHGGKFVSCARDLWRGIQLFQYILVQENHNLWHGKSELATMDIFSSFYTPQPTTDNVKCLHSVIF